MSKAGLIQLLSKNPSPGSPLLLPLGPCIRTAHGTGQALSKRLLPGRVMGGHGVVAPGAADLHSR